MFYLEKVIAIIGEREYEEALTKLADTLQEQGMEFQCLSLEDMGGNGMQSIAPERLAAGEKTRLYMTDVSELAGELREHNYPVLAFLHEKNRDRDFAAVRYACEEPWETDAEYMEGVYRRYMQIPREILETDRCLIRETTPDDAEAFYEIYGNPSITRYTDGILADVEQERQYINDYIKQVYGFYDFGVWTIVKKDTREVIGRVGFSYREGYDEPEMGFVIGVPWQRQGFAEEVCSAVLKYGRKDLGFAVVQAFVRPENKASLALCHKLGMQPAREVIISGKEYLCMKMKL